MKRTVSIILTMLMAFCMLMVVSCKPEADVPADDPLFEVEDLEDWKITPGTYEMYEETDKKKPRLPSGDEYYDSNKKLMGTLVLEGNEEESTVFFCIDCCEYTEVYHSAPGYEALKNIPEWDNPLIKFDDKNLSFTAKSSEPIDDFCEFNPEYNCLYHELQNNWNGSLQYIKQNASGTVIEIYAESEFAGNFSGYTLRLKKKR